jgi:hypothetical protein
MKKDEVLKVLETAKGDESFIVRTEAEDKTFLENYGKKIEEEVIPSKISELHTRYDDDIFAVTGLKKNPTEKTYDFTKRVLSEFKTKAEKSSVLEKEIGELKKQLADGTGDKKTLADLEAMQRAYKELEDTKTKEVTELRTQFEKYKDESEIVAATSGMAFKKNIPEAAIKSLMKQIISDLTSIASRQDGKLVFLKDGVPMRNPHNALNPYTADELLKERLKDVIDIGRKAEGGPGLESEIVKEYDKDKKLTKVTLLIPDSVKTKEDLSKFLVSQKLLRGTQEYLLAYKEYSENLPRA